MTFDDGDTIRVYSLVDLVAEKFRALLQQEIRRLVRKQDIYDLHFLLIEQRKAHDNWHKIKIINSLREKAAARNLAVGRESMANTEIIRRTKSNYQLLVAEIEGELLPFQQVYSAVQTYYEGMPWE